MLKLIRPIAIISIVFENRETMLWQIHEMMRTEGLTKPGAIAHECEVYSKLLPTTHELAATLYIELPYDENIRAALDRLIGVDESTGLQVGEENVPASFDPGQHDEDRISSVHYIRFRFSDAQRVAFLERSHGRRGRLPRRRLLDQFRRKREHPFLEYGERRPEQSKRHKSVGQHDVLLPGRQPEP